MLQEIFGVNSHIRSVADGYAADGYLCIAPSLFDRAEPGVELGYTADDVQRGLKLRSACPTEAVLQDIEAAIAQVQPAGRVGIVGYCWGGTLAWLAACRLDSLSVAACYYGGGMAEHANEKPKCAVVAHFGVQDESIPVTAVDTFRIAQPDVDVHMYPAGHGFNCDQRGSFDADSAARARSQTLEYFRKYVG